MKKIKLLIIIVDRSIVDKVNNTIIKMGASFSHICYGIGTAKNDLLNLLGLGETEKGIIFASIDETMIKPLYEKLIKIFGFNKPGGGIAFTIPITSVGGPASLKILEG